MCEDSKSIKNQIDLMKEYLNKALENEGLQSKNILNTSQKLDKLINQYIRLLMEDK